MEGWFQDNRFLYIVLQLVLGGEMYSLLKMKESFDVYQVK
jgi:hypothetical protein